MITGYFSDLLRSIHNGWTRFWFSASSCYTLAMIRVFTGFMMAYMHVVWCLQLEDFFGPHAMINRSTNTLIHANDFTWSYLRYTDSPTFLWCHQIAAVVVCCALGLGLLARITGPLAWFMTLMVCHRATGHLFGLDQTIMMLALALAISPCSAALSLDAKLRNRLSTEQQQKAFWDWLLPADCPSTMITFATRMIQVQLCVIYLFGGLSKMRGSMWWDGSAMWFAASSYEYQSLDFTWIGRWPMLGGIIAHLTIFWEAFYCVAVWPKRSRPIVLAIAFLVHFSIMAFLGMITFGLMMIVANLAFVTPEFMRRIFPFFRRSTSPTPSSTALRNAPSHL